MLVRTRLALVTILVALVALLTQAPSAWSQSPSDTVELLAQLPSASPRSYTHATTPGDGPGPNLASGANRGAGHHRITLTDCADARQTPCPDHALSPASSV